MSSQETPLLGQDYVRIWCCKCILSETGSGDKDGIVKRSQNICGINSEEYKKSNASKILSKLADRLLRLSFVAYLSHQRKFSWLNPSMLLNMKHLCYLDVPVPVTPTKQQSQYGVLLRDCLLGFFKRYFSF